MSLTIEKILLTGATGSFGQAFIKNLLLQKSFKGVIRAYSRDEFKQYHLQEKYKDDPRIRFFIGDIRDKSRLQRATNGVDILIHAAALKQIPILEYNPFEAVSTNILGSQNVIESAIDAKVKKSILISSDKAVSPINLYGATKLVAEKLFVQGNSYVGKNPTKFSVVRYGNVMASRGSVVPAFIQQAKDNLIKITDERMTRFWITLDQGVNFVLMCLKIMKGGEIFVPKLPSVRIVNLARTIAPYAKLKMVGPRPGEKLSEVLINTEESRRTKKLKDFFIIESEFNWWDTKTNKNNIKKNDDGFIYSSDTNSEFLTMAQIKKMVSEID